MSSFDVIGKEITRRDAYDKVTGRAEYVADLNLPGMVYGKMIHSPVAHAIFKSIDTSKALALPGVVDITTFEDIPEIPYTSCGHPRPYDTPADLFIYNRHARYVGDPIGCVVAETPEIAEEAVRLLTYEYEELPFYLTPDEAMA
ncbi:MAG: hypothetical protein KBS83_03275, partial [Lachnospiraceae bacterium]|nr:hypothetical protein [Candidatus Equihabitans merdae]